MSDEQESAHRFPITIIDETENYQDESGSSQAVEKGHRASQACSSTKTEVATSNLEAIDIHQSSIDKRNFTNIELQRENIKENDILTKHDYFDKSSPEETREPDDRKGLIETEGWHTEYDSLEAGQTEETSEIEIIPKTKAVTKMYPWDQHDLHQSLILEKYLEVTNVPTNSTFESLMACLGLQSPIFQQSPNLVYCEGETTALIICYNREDAERLLSRYCKNMTFKRVKPKVLSNVMYSVDEDFWKELKQQDTLYASFKVEMQNAGVSVLEKESTRLLSPTTYQHLYAVQQIRSYRKRCRASVSLEIIEHMHNVSESVWQFVIRSSWKTNLETNNISIRYVDSSIILQGTSIDSQHFKSFRDFVRSLEIREICEFQCAKARTEDAHKWCSEANNSVGYECCCYIEERQTVLVLCKDYIEYLQIRHMFDLRTGIRKPTGRSKRRADILSKSETSSSSLGREQSPVPKFGHSDFNWDVETKHVKQYETNEGIKVYVYKATILKLPVDCIVNVTNDSLSHRDGIAREIADAAGYKMLDQDRKYVKINGKLKVGSVCSSSPGNLPYACVIHTVGPAWTDYAKYTYQDARTAEHDLYSGVYNSFCEAESHKLTSIALPLVIVAHCGVPKEMSVYQYAKATIDYSRSSTRGRSLKEIHFIDENYEMVKALQDIFKCWLVDQKIPVYDTHKFVNTPECRTTLSGEKTAKQSSPSEALSVVKKTGKTIANKKAPTALSFKKTGSFEYIFCSKKNKLILSRQDILTIKADAIVVTVSPTGKFGQIGGLVFGNRDANDFKQLLDNKTTGDVLHVSGRGTYFKSILLLVMDANFRNENVIVRRSILRDAYLKIFDMCAQQNISTVSVTLIGIDIHKAGDVLMCSEVFLQSYTDHCALTSEYSNTKTLKVNLVFKDDVSFGITQSILEKYVDQSKAEENTRLTQQPRNVERDDCDACLEPTEELQMLTCGHMFCDACLQSFIGIRHDCPICSTVLGNPTDGGHLDPVIDKFSTMLNSR